MDKSYINKIAVNFSGIAAYQVLQLSKEASVIGATSRGVFLKTDLNWIIFVSLEKYRNPLTINVIKKDFLLQELNNNRKVIIYDGNILIPSMNTQMMVSESEIWNPGWKEGDSLSNSQINLNIRDITNILHDEKHDIGLVNDLYSFVMGEYHKNETQNLLFSQIDFLELYQSYILSHKKLFFRNIIPLLGLGVGLTPSGDDFIIGFLLACNAFPNLSCTKIDLREMNQKIIEEAYKKTNLISANLIDCATQGLGDERLVTVLEEIVFGNIDPVSSAYSLMQWGSSSGCDAFFGIAAALLKDN